jgi:hypothetical protein
MPRSDRKTQIRLTRDTADTLRRLAADLGYVQTRGIMAGELGSVAQMFDAVARGELTIVKTDDKRSDKDAHPDNPAS